MQTKKGFLLLESLIYLSCTVILFTAFFTFSYCFYNKAYLYTGKIQKYIEFAVGLDYLVDDINQLSCNNNLWIIREKVRIIFTNKNNKNIGWYIKNNKLLRYQGNFNLKNNHWNKYTVSLVISDVDKLEFEYKYKKYKLVGIKIILAAKSFELSRFVAIKNE